MHPQVIQDHPGNCPICGMKLTPIRSRPEPPARPPNPRAIAVDPVTMQNMDIRTAVVTRGPLRRTIRTVGTVDYNETTLAEVTTKFKGWIEKLYVNATGQLVMQGDPLFRNLFARTLQRPGRISARARISRPSPRRQRLRSRPAR